MRNTYKKSFSVLLEESVGGTTHAFSSCSLTAALGPRPVPLLDTYLPKCDGPSAARTAEDALLCVRVLGKIPVQKVRDAVLRQGLRGCARRDSVRAAGCVEYAGTGKHFSDIVLAGWMTAE